MVERLDLRTWVCRCCDEIIAIGVRSGASDEIYVDGAAEFDPMYEALGKNCADLEQIVNA